MFLQTLFKRLARETPTPPIRPTQTRFVTSNDEWEGTSVDHYVTFHHTITIRDICERIQREDLPRWHYLTAIHPHLAEEKFLAFEKLTLAQYCWLKEVRHEKKLAKKRAKFAEKREKKLRRMKAVVPYNMPTSFFEIKAKVEVGALFVLEFKVPANEGASPLFASPLPRSVATTIAVGAVIANKKAALFRPKVPEIKVATEVTKFPCIEEKVLEHKDARTLGDRELALLAFELDGFSAGPMLEAAKKLSKTLQSFLDSPKTPEFKGDLAKYVRANIPVIEESASAPIDSKEDADTQTASAASAKPTSFSGRFKKFFKDLPRLFGRRPAKS